MVIKWQSIYYVGIITLDVKKEKTMDLSKAPIRVLAERVFSKNLQIGEIPVARRDAVLKDVAEVEKAAKARAAKAAKK